VTLSEGRLARAISAYPFRKMPRAAAHSMRAPSRNALACRSFMMRTRRYGVSGPEAMGHALTTAKAPELELPDCRASRSA